MSDKLISPLDWESADLNNFPELPNSECHLWCLPLTLSDTDYELTESWLSEHQRDKLSRRKSVTAKRNYLAGRYYIFRLLAQYANIPESQIQLSYSRLGKPYLAAEQFDLHFNFSDTQQAGNGYCALFFCRNHAVGVDLEFRTRKTNFKLIAEDRFSNNEIVAITDAESRIVPSSFLAIWTRKEAYGKAIGKGINFKMQAHDFYQDGSLPLNFIDPADQAWRLYQVALEEQGLIACAAHAGHQALTLRGFNKLTA